MYFEMEKRREERFFKQRESSNIGVLFILLCLYYTKASGVAFMRHVYL